MGKGVSNSLVSTQRNSQLKFIIFVKNWKMVTIEVNKRTKAGKALIETARLMAQKFKGINIIEDDKILINKMKKNQKDNLISDSEKSNFMKELREIAR